MNDCHSLAVEWMKSFLNQLIFHENIRALEVACGNGCLTRDLLSEMYAEVDMFDKTTDAVEDAGNETLNCEIPIDI